MNHELQQLAAAARLEDRASEPLRLAFGLACAQRVKHLLEDQRALECLAVLEAFVAGKVDVAALSTASQAIAAIATGHHGSNSIDGSSHAAVSATYATANALAGHALDAASYAAYASVYAYGSYAVNDPSAFESEFAWQVETFKELSRFHAQHGSA